MMFKREAAEEIVSLLGEGAELNGDLSFNKGLRIDGLVKGRIRSDAFLVIGPKGKVDAEIDIRKVSIKGEFRGVIHASDRVEIHKDGKVHGDLFTPCLIIEAGALFDGKCNMSQQSPAQSGSAENQARTVESSAALE